LGVLPAALYNPALHCTTLLAGPVTALQGLERLTALKDLTLGGGRIEASCLLSVTTGLTYLNLWDVTLRPKHVQQKSALGTSQLLQLLARLPALRELLMDGVHGDWPQQLSLHSALTASSNLTQLWIRGCDIQRAAWQHLFPAGRTMTQLHAFDATLHMATGPAPFRTDDIMRLVSCCPALHWLELSISPDASLVPLKSLTALTHLGLFSVKPSDIRSDLAALTQLQVLRMSVYLPGRHTASVLQHLVPLTALTTLTSLYCYDTGFGALHSKVSATCLQC
jgi:hypothetical protein